MDKNIFQPTNGLFDANPDLDKAIQEVSEATTEYELLKQKLLAQYGVTFERALTIEEKVSFKSKLDEARDPGMNDDGYNYVKGLCDKEPGKILYHHGRKKYHVTNIYGVHKSFDTKTDANKHKNSEVSEGYRAEQDSLTELSKKTVGNYIKGAADDMNDQAFIAGGANKNHSTMQGKHTLDADIKAQKRLVGIKTASNKLTGDAKVNVKENDDENDITESKNNRTKGYIGTYDDPNHPHIAAVKSRVKEYNSKNGTDFRVSTEGRMGKNNPNADKYKQPNKHGNTHNRYQNIAKGDAQHHDVYINSRHVMDRDESDFHINTIKSKLPKRKTNESLDEVSHNRIVKVDRKPDSWTKSVEKKFSKKIEPEKKENKAPIPSLKSEGKDWIAGAIKHPGALTRSAKAAGETDSEYEQEHKHDSDKAGQRARLALTLKNMRKK